MQFKVLFASVIFILRNYINGVPIQTAPASVDLDSYFTPHIIGGAEAPQGYAPYMAAILIGDAVTMIACGGSIVLPKLILTAAHCIDVYEVPGGLMESFHAVVGSNNFKSGGTVVDVEDYHIHPEWDSILMKNDIGFLCPAEEIQMNEKVQPVALNFEYIAGHELSFVTGWGLVTTRPAITPFNLQILVVNTLTPKDCVDVIREASANWWPQAPLVDPALEICSLNTDGRREVQMENGRGGLCYGDSGSPLMSRKSRTQIGITSWAIPCAITGVPDMHVRLSAYKDYIQSIIGKYRS